MKYYVYALTDPRKSGQFIYGDLSFNYEPFYIGKGHGSRLKHHTNKSEIKKCGNSIKNNKIKQIIKNGYNPNNYAIILKEFDLEKDALEYEILLIKLIGRIKLNTGPLSNMTDGGESCSPCKGRTYEEIHGKKEAERLKKIRRQWMLSNDNPRKGKPAWNKGIKGSTWKNKNKVKE